MRHWKLSPMDVESWRHWWQYTQAYERMVAETDTEWAPWYIVDANVKRHARLNLIRHLLDQIPYEDLPAETIELPERPPKGDYVPPEESTLNIVPSYYP